MIRYHFDLYPRDDPRDGARVVRFTKLQSAEYRGEANGTGSGRLSIRADVAEAQLIDPRGLQYVRVVREDTVAVTEAVVGGFWLETGDFTLLDEQGTRLLSFGGAGTLAYLSRAVMWSHTYISPIFTGQDPISDVWNLWNQSTFYANGNFLGAMLWRVLYEAQHNTPGTHRHADGVNVSDTHDDDRPAIAIADMVFNFDQYEDTNGNDWTLTSGEFKAQVGENVLAVVKRLMEAGLYVEMDPDTFELSAYQAATHRRDRTGVAWGASVVRFQAPVGEDIDTGNIKSDAKRAIAAFIKRSVVLAGGNDVFGIDTGASDIPWEGFYYADVNDQDAAENIASVQIGARDDAGDTLRIRGRLGTDKNAGYYRPFEDALLDDLATVHTGSNQFDLDEQDFPIAAITVNLRPGGDWDVWYDLGSSYSAASSRQFQVAPVPAHNHTIPFCTPGTIGVQGAMEVTTWPHPEHGTTRVEYGYVTADDTHVVLYDSNTDSEPFAATVNVPVARWFERVEGGGGAGTHYDDEADWCNVTGNTQSWDWTGPSDDYNDLIVVLTPFGAYPQDTVHQGEESSGTSSQAARCDHKHAHGLLSDDGLHYHNPEDIEGVSETVIDHGTMGAAETFDASAGHDHEGVQDANLTVTLTGATSGEAAWMTLVLTQDGGGGNTINLPSSVLNEAEIEAAWDTTAGAVNILTAFSYDGGTTWYAALLGGGGSSVGALDDLSDVTITSVATADRLRYDGSAYDGTNWLPAVDGDGNAIVTEA
jgi:hypothetical protein